jgi:mannose-6-phosphate isomerase
MTAVFKLTPSVQTYDWGKLGRASKVAQLAERGTARGFTLDESTPYAEVRVLLLRDRSMR